MATDNGYTGHMLKPLQWAKSPAADVPTTTLANGKLAEVLASVLYAYDGSDLTVVSKDSSTGALKVYVSGSAAATVPTAATATLTNVNDTNVSTTILAANTARLGAIVVNDSTADLYLKFGTTASATSFSVHLYPGQTWEMDTSLIYTGKIDGIWSSDASGAARITELTA